MCECWSRTEPEEHQYFRDRHGTRAPKGVNRQKENKVPITKGEKGVKFFNFSWCVGHESQTLNIKITAQITKER